MNKPHYVFRPLQLVRRISATGRSFDANETVVRALPWDVVIECWPADAIGSSIARTGIYDLLATEALFRLADPGDLTIDAGANIGHMTSALARAAGRGGRVLSFEPHPDVLAVLDRNVRRWQLDPTMATIETYASGLSRSSGRGTLVTPEGFEANRGTSRVVVGGVAAENERATEIALTRLDAVVRGPVGVLKLDVEGHEAAVIDGASGLLSAGAVRDIVFEDVDPSPTEVIRSLEARGFEVRELLQQLRGPRLVAPSVPRERASWDPPVLIASRDPTRLQRRFARHGWWALRPPARRET